MSTGNPTFSFQEEVLVLNNHVCPLSIDLPRLRFPQRVFVCEQRSKTERKRAIDGRSASFRGIAYRTTRSSGDRLGDQSSRATSRTRRVAFSKIKIEKPPPRRPSDDVFAFSPTAFQHNADNSIGFGKFDRTGTSQRKQKNFSKHCSRRSNCRNDVSARGNDRDIRNPTSSRPVHTHIEYDVYMCNDTMRECDVDRHNEIYLENARAGVCLCVRGPP